MGDQEKECEGGFVFKGTVSQDGVGLISFGWRSFHCLSVLPQYVLRGQGPLLQAENQLEIKIAGRDRQHAPFSPRDRPARLEQP